MYCDTEIIQISQIFGATQSKIIFINFISLFYFNFIEIMNSSIQKSTSKHIINKTKSPKRVLPRSKSTDNIKLNKKKFEDKITVNACYHLDVSRNCMLSPKSLPKSKSSKSLKYKHKQENSLTKKINQKKKGQKGKKSKTQKLKKSKKILSEKAFNEIQVEKVVPELKFNPCYFLYNNTYIPIQNSAQQRFVSKIQMIDQVNNSTTDTFFEKNNKDQEVQTIIIEKQEKSCQMLQKVQQKQCQTSTEVANKYQQDISRCFVNCLTELEFLYLPNDNNFKQFNNQQRQHYGELLQILSRKILIKQESNSPRQSSMFMTTQSFNQQLKMLLFQRESIQLCTINQEQLQQGFPTHIYTIAAYITYFLSYIYEHYKDDLIRNLRLIYGDNYYSKVKNIHKDKIRLPGAVISSQIFEEFEGQMFKDHQFLSEDVEVSIHVHNRAIFDAINDYLETYRPFYSCNGEPYPWNLTLGLTHYQINEQALPIIFQELKQKIIKQASLLNGLVIDTDHKYHESQIYQNYLTCQENKMFKSQVEKCDDIQIGEEDVKLRFGVTEQIFEQLIQEIGMEVAAFKQPGVEELFQFYN